MGRAEIDRVIAPAQDPRLQWAGEGGLSSSDSQGDPAHHCRTERRDCDKRSGGAGWRDDRLPAWPCLSVEGGVVVGREPRLVEAGRSAREPDAPPLIVHSLPAAPGERRS